MLIIKIYVGQCPQIWSIPFVSFLPNNTMSWTTSESTCHSLTVGSAQLDYSSSPFFFRANRLKASVAIALSCSKVAMGPVPCHIPAHRLIGQTPYSIGYVALQARRHFCIF